MPLGTVCVSTVGSRPRTWSSYSNIRAKDAQDILNMNSTDEILVYKDPQEVYPSPTLARRTLGYSYDFPEKSQKKEKKWSISNIFRRKKKDESDSSSEEELQKKGFLGRRKKKSESRRKKPIKTIGTFDHVVVPPGPRNSLHNGYNCNEETGVLSDPTGGFSHYVGRALPQVPPGGDSCQKISRESLNDSNLSKVSIGSGSVDSIRKSRREMTKVRAEARRTSSKNSKDGSSSEGESQRSNSSLKIRSEENLQARDSSANRKSRAARTERYLKRHSRDGENPHNYLRLSKSDAENSSINWKQSDDSNRSPSRSPLVPSSVIPTDAKNKLSFSSLNSSSNISGLSTIPPSHGNQTKYRISNSTSNSSYKPPQSMNDYNKSTQRSIDSNIDKYFIDQRSISCDGDIHIAPSESHQDVLHVQFPITRPNLGLRNRILHDSSQLNKNKQPPPPPPPRDPSRVGNHFHEIPRSRPNTFYFDSSGQTKSKSFTTSHAHPGLQQTRKFNSFNLYPSYRSTSEDHLPRDSLKVQLADRPSSTTPEANKPQRYISRRGDVRATTEDFNYLADKHPRSRKPISIQPSNNTCDNDIHEAGSQKALNFWKQIDRQTITSNKPILKKTRSDSPQMFTSHTKIQNKIFLPSVLQHDITKPSSRGSSPFKPGTPTLPETVKPLEISYHAVLGEVSKDDIKRKSSNLEEALDELEAIYNSLRLGDEDLLERAEQREKETQNKKLPIELLNSYPSYTSRGALSDSSFSYEPFDSVDSPRRKKIMRKNRTLDIKQDDMAFRKMNKYRANTIGDPQAHMSKVSYLLSSPVFSGDHQEEEVPSENNNEPDITKDDVVYRNVKHMNNALRVVDPQPPFGIPIGPITPGANSDYLHAKPEDIFTPTFTPRKIPDIVKDDLAFRNLRKDNNKGPALPPLSTEDFKNNNSDDMKFDLNYLKKKRAQRSLSANISSLMHSDIIERAKLKQKPTDGVENEFKSFKTLTDIADAMEIARSVLKEKENKITNTRKAFMSDTDTKYIHPIANRNNMVESRQNFFNSLKNSHGNHNLTSKPSSRLEEDKLSAKPPRGQTPERIRSPKESTPIPLSPMEDKQAVQSESTSSSLDDLLNALAEEAKETTERITNELNMLRDEREKEKLSLEKASVVEPQKVEIETNEDISKTFSEIDSVSEHGNLREKLLECVVDSNELMASTKSEEEIVNKIDEEKAVAESANIVMSRTGSKEDQFVSDESEHDYENLVSDKELNDVDEIDLDISRTDTKDPEESRSAFEEHKAELIASFQELKEHMEDIKLPMRRDKGENAVKIDHTSAKVDSVYDNIDTVDKDENDGVAGEEVCSGVVALQVKECAFTINTNTFDSDQLFASNCDIVLCKPVSFNLQDDSETSSGFHSNCSCGENSQCIKSEVAFDEIDTGASSNLDSLESLKSPKLVMETSSKVSIQERSGNKSNNFVGTSNRPGTSRAGFSRTSVISRGIDRSDRHILDDAEKPTPSWYRDPASVAFACSYGVACAHHLASIDLFAILSIMFAVISFIAALFL